MNNARRTQRFRPYQYVAWFIAFAFVILCFTSVSETQSGRRTPKREKSEGVQPSTEKEIPIDASKAETTKAEPVKISILLATDRFAFYYSQIYLTAMMESCATRLRQAALSSVRIAEKDMNRKEASDYAKNSTEVNVAWLEMGREGMSNSIEDMVINYSLFAPGTSKAKTQGRVFLRRRSTGGIGLPAPSGSPAALDYALKQAGREVADRILSSLNLSVPPGR